MRKIIALIFLAIVMCVSLAAQKHSSVPLNDSVYALLANLQMRSLAPALPLAKPYSEGQIISAVQNILHTEDLAEKLSDAEKQMLENVLRRFDRKPGFDLRRGALFLKNEKDTVKLDLGLATDISFSAGLFNDNIQRINYDVFLPKVKLNFGLWDFLSARFDLFVLFMQAPLDKMGTYDIGGWWYGNYPSAGDVATQGGREISAYANYASFPFLYDKKWDGSIYLLANITADGHTGWPVKASMGFGVDAEISAGFFENDLTVRAGRLAREWAGMDTGASLVLNARAQPFVGGEFSATLFKWLSFSALFGSLEIPRAGHITGNAFPASGASESAAAFQNNFAVDMIEVNFKYVHFDFGTSLVMRRRFEIGYLFPLVGKLLYQNNIGDFDNLAMFVDLKLQWPGIGNVWFSFFLDEMDMFNKTTGVGSGKNFFEATRNMYAFQVGTKAALPFWDFLPFATVSFRYTKIEPYCYTHQLINNTPWTNNYVSTSYMNSGASLGYYLPPNSDEIFVRFDTAPLENLLAHLQYQFMRHGADYGTRAVRGSSLYSEMNPSNSYRTSMKKYFLRDGAYQWIHSLKIGGEYDMRDLIKFPLTVYGDIGFVYSYFTDSDTGSGEEQYRDGSYHLIDTAEYPTRYGAIISLGMRIFY